MERSTLLAKTEGPSMDGCNAGVSMDVEEVVERVVLNSAGRVRDSSIDCCEDGTTSPSKGVADGDLVGEGVVEMDAVEGGALEMSGRSEVVTCSYPDSPSVSMMSGAPSMESRRDRVAAAGLGLSRIL